MQILRLFRFDTLDSFNGKNFPVFIIPLFFLFWYHNPVWVLACSMIFFHSDLSPTQSSPASKNIHTSFLELLATISFVQDMVIGSTPNPQPRGPGIFLIRIPTSETSYLHYSFRSLLRSLGFLQSGLLLAFGGTNPYPCRAAQESE